MNKSSGRRPRSLIKDHPLRKTGIPLADSVSAGDEKRHFSTPRGMTQEDGVSSYYGARYHEKMRG